MSGEGLSDAARTVWAKSSRDDEGWLPLWCHLDDSGRVAARLWDEWLPKAVVERIAGCLPGGLEDGRALVTWLAGIHDIGKATPAFAHQVPFLAGRMHDHGLETPTKINSSARRLTRHAAAGELLLEEWLEKTHGWERVSQARQFAIVVGGHHGSPPVGQELLAHLDYPHLLGLRRGQDAWQAVQRELLEWATNQWGVADRLADWVGVRLPQPVQAVLTGIVIVADWIASDETRFGYDLSVDTDLEERFETAWDQLDLPAPWRAVPQTEHGFEAAFASRFELPANSRPRPVQSAAMDLASDMSTPGLMIIEAPMGEGKTEAALAAAEVLAGRSGAGGCFIALPTRATSDAMFLRVLAWMRNLPDADPGRGALSVRLAHGKARFNEDFKALFGDVQSSGVGLDESAGRTRQDVAAHHWMRGRKKALLSAFVIGTIDQFLMAALKARHVVLRHLGLAGKVVIIDEAHAYDVYMSEYLDRALEWTAAHGVPVVVLSATLPAARRKELVQAYDRGRGQPLADEMYAGLDGDIGYPVLVASGGKPLVRLAESSGRRVPVMVERLDDDLSVLADALRRGLAEGGCALVVRNTVRRVQEAARALRQELRADEIEVSVAHSRYLAPDRMANDTWLRDSFGPPDRGDGRQRPDRHVVVASQVAEQSLDLDFDLLVTDLAPADLVLQRMGRLHRHRRGDGESDRPSPLRTARCLLTGVDWAGSAPGPPTLVRGSILVYGRHALLRSLAVLTPYLDSGRAIELPTDIAPIVQSAYSDAPIGPSEWRPELDGAAGEDARRREKKRSKAATFRLDSVREDGEPLVGWLDAGVGDPDRNARAEREGRAQVRDTPGESVEVIVVVRRFDGTLCTPPWLAHDGDWTIREDSVPFWPLPIVLATCTLSLPIELCTVETIEELEQTNDFTAWRSSLWLEGELILVLDEVDKESGRAALSGFDLLYSRSDGLVVRRGEQSHER